MITFKQQFSFEEDSVKGFAKFLGWQEKLVRKIEVVDEVVEPAPEPSEIYGEQEPIVTTTTHFEDEEYDNPETFIEFVEKKAKEHSLEFTKSWATKLVNDEIARQKKELEATVRPQLTEAIVKPVEDALSSEVINENE